MVDFPLYLSFLRFEKLGMAGLLELNPDFHRRISGETRVSTRPVSSRLVEKKPSELVVRILDLNSGDVVASVNLPKPGAAASASIASIALDRSGIQIWKIGD